MRPGRAHAKDPRVKPVSPVIKYADHVGSRISTENINTYAFRSWISKQLAQYTDDEFIFDQVMGFLEGEEIKSKDLGAMLTTYIGEHAVPFVEKLWKLLIEASKSKTGIPKEILEETRKEIAEKAAAQTEPQKEKRRENASEHRHRRSPEDEYRRYEREDGEYPRRHRGEHRSYRDDEYEDRVRDRYEREYRRNRASRY